ncbi:MAG: DUF6883 domain-containing protein [Tepidisphaeraceae bacterium]
MKLPNGDRAIVSNEKLLDYLLNDQHETQSGHAELFKRLLGIGPHDADVLRAALLRAAATEEAALGALSPHGTKYEIRFEMTGPRRAYTILSVWMIENGKTEPRLITAYVE